MLRERAADLIAWLRRRCSPPRQAPPEPRNLPKSSEAAGDGDASAARSRHFAHVAHELRTPLNAILGFSEMIRCEAFGPVGDPHYAEYAGLIHDAAKHLTSLIDDLLDMAKLESGKAEIAPIRVSAAALARSVFDLVDLSAQQRQVALTCEGTDTCSDLFVDPRAAKQVLLNLVSNAVKFTPEGGRIEVRFAKRPCGGVSISVADTGIGMSAAEIAVAFEPFGRASKGEPGTGLGLPLALALVDLHGGELSLVSEPGRGTTATVQFPPEPATSRPDPASPARAEIVRAA